MQTKYDASSNFVSDTNASNKDATAIFMMQMSHCRDENAKFIHDDAGAHIYTMMPTSPCRDGDAKILGCKCPLMGMS